MNAPLEQAVVLKLGGSTIDSLSPDWWDSAAWVAAERKLVCLHGWSRPLMAFRAQHGRESTYLIDKHGYRSRLTDESVLDDIVTVSAVLREQIHGAFAARGLRVRAVVGADEKLLEAEVRRNMWWVGSELQALANLVGPITRVDSDALRVLLATTDVLVVTPLAWSAAQPRVNVDGDRAAGCVSAALNAAELVLVTNVEAVCFEGAPLRRITLDELRPVTKAASGGMVKKLNAARTAVEGGVKRVLIGSDGATELLAGRSGTEVVP